MEKKFGTPEGIERAKMSLQSLVRVMILTVKAADVGPPLDLDSMSFWCHSSAYLGAVTHIKLGIRNGEWQQDLDCLKRYLGFFKKRLKLYGMFSIIQKGVRSLLIILKPIT